MSDPGSTSQPSTPEATKAGAQSRGPAPPAGPARREAAPDPRAGLGRDFRIGRGVTRLGARPYQIGSDDPLYRPLRIYTIDPGESGEVGAESVVNVPWEPLRPGPVGRLFEVDSRDGADGVHYRKVDLNEHRLLLEQGLAPTPADARFHQQMTYAVCSTVYHAFRRALGRDVSWGFDPRPAPGAGSGQAEADGEPDPEADADVEEAADDPPGERLRILPYAMRERNAFYDKSAGELRFGYYEAERRVAGTNLPRGIVFTSLSHDVVAHEMSHALLDGLRAHFALPTGPDVLALHEAFADLVAVFQHFSYKEVVREALRRSRGDLRNASLLVEIGRQFGHTTRGHEHARALRTAFDVQSVGRAPLRYDARLPTHELGSVLVAAVFGAFVTLFERKTERYRLLSTGGTGALPAGELPPALQEVLADEASQLASQFLTICIRAIDYCPPVDVELGEYLRALITADYDLVRDDPWNYREALVAAFKERDIYPRGVRFLSLDALLWNPPTRDLRAVQGLSFAELRFRGDPGRAASRAELCRQACEIGRLVSAPENRDIFGLAAPTEDARGTIDPPCVESVRSSRRVGPNGQVVFDLIAEVTQRREIADPDGAFDFYGGATLILGPTGKVRFVISKSVLNEERVERQREYVRGAGAAYWTREGTRRVPSPSPFRLAHGRAG